MKEMIKKVRQDKGGFTLAELLVVVAIILVLVAIAIPVFMGAQDRADTAVAEGDIRSAKAAAASKYLLDGETTSPLSYTVTFNNNGDMVDIEKDANLETPTPVDGTDGVKERIKNASGSTTDTTFEITVQVTGTDLVN